MKSDVSMIIPIKRIRIRLQIPAISTVVLSSGSLPEKETPNPPLRDRSSRLLAAWEQIRSQESVFDKDCDVYTYDVHDDSILCILRQKGNERFIGIFNFSDSEKTAWMQEEGTFRDLITDQTLELKDVELPAYGFMWCKRM